jgi:hypothetical protein
VSRPARSLSEQYSELLHVSKVLEGLKTWLQSMNDASAPDVVGGETTETETPQAPPPVRASVRLQSGAIVGIFILLVFYFLYFASPILIPINRGVAPEDAVGALCGPARTSSHTALS